MAVFEHARLREARDIMRRLMEAGYSAYLVGGFVRDHVLGRPVQDIDIATSAVPTDVMRLFERAIPTGIEHGTVTVISGGFSFEVTTFRRDGKYEDHRRPESVEFVDSLTEDLSRRDFTMNAMAMDIDGRIIDPFRGQEDLAAGVLRCVGKAEKRFSEDALRMLRCIRFAANYDLRIDDDSWAALLKLRESLRHIAMERVRIELVKTIEGAHPERGLDLLLRSRLLACTKEPLGWRPYADPPSRARAEGDGAEADGRLAVFASSPNATSSADPAGVSGPSRMPGSFPAPAGLSEMSAGARWASLFVAGGHTAEEADTIMRKLTFSNDAKQHIVRIVSMYHDVRSSWRELCDRKAPPSAAGDGEFLEGYRSKLVECAIRYGREAAFECAELLERPEADRPKAVDGKTVRTWLDSVAVWTPVELAVSGHDMMALTKEKRPGPWLGKLLHRLTLDAALGYVTNAKEELISRAKYYLEAWDMH
jgi:tRNA nucleotidyltransferase (CCA-adding enzyme)